jgi:hypothetical protein
LPQCHLGGTLTVTTRLCTGQHGTFDLHHWVLALFREPELLADRVEPRLVGARELFAHAHQVAVEIAREPGVDVQLRVRVLRLDEGLEAAPDEPPAPGVIDRFR